MVTHILEECSGRIVSVEVFHEENFETKAGEEQDVVKLIDPESKSWEKDLMLDVMKYKSSLQQNDVGDAKSLRHNDGSHQNHKLAKTKATLHRPEDLKMKGKEDKQIGREAEIKNLENQNYQNDNQHDNHKEDKSILGELKSVIKTEKVKHQNSHHRKIPRKYIRHHHRKEKAWNDEENQIDSDLKQKVMDIKEEDRRIENQLSPPVVPTEDEDTKGGPQIPRPLLRMKRQLDINAIADAHLQNSSSSKKEDSVDVITADDRNEEARAKARQADLLKYLGGTLISVAIFSFIGYCFVKDPKGCIHAFGMGCPCCIVCLPCIRKCQEKTDMEAVMKENMNRYMPGMVIYEDGTIEAYEVSPEEIDIVMEIVDIIKE